MSEETTWSACHVRLRLPSAGTVSAMLEWSINERPGGNGLVNLYVRPRSVTREKGQEQDVEQGHEVLLSDPLLSSFTELRLRLADKASALGSFLDGLFSEPRSGAAFLLPSQEGYAGHSGFVVDRLVRSVLALSPRSFLTPGVKVTPFHSTISTALRSHKALGHALEAAIGAVYLSADTRLPDLELDLDQRLSLPWLLGERPQDSRSGVCVWSWTFAAAEGMRVDVTDMFDRWSMTNRNINPAD